MFPLPIWRLFNYRIYRIWSCFRNSASKGLHFVNNKYFIVNLLRYFFFQKRVFSKSQIKQEYTFEEDLYFNFFHTIQPFHERCLHLADCMILRGPFMKIILAISKFYNLSPKRKRAFTRFPNKTAYQFIPKITMNSYFNKNIIQTY